MLALAVSMHEGAAVPIPGADPWFANPDDPAITVMTDFRERASVTVSDCAPIDAALEHMKHAGVRCAFAIDDEQRLVVGLITAYDILSEKPLRHMRAVDVPRHELRVRDIMQPLAECGVTDVRSIERATVESVYRIFERSGLSHLPVMETTADGGSRLSGLLSAAQVRRLLMRS